MFYFLSLCVLPFISKQLQFVDCSMFFFLLLALFFIFSYRFFFLCLLFSVPFYIVSLSFLSSFFFIVLSFSCLCEIYQSNAKTIKKKAKTTSSTAPAEGQNRKGVFLVSAKNAFVRVKRNNRVNTYSRISTVPRGSERSQWASPWTERASEASGAKRSAAEQVSGVSGASERT